QSLLFDDVTLDRDDRCRSMSDHGLSDYGWAFCRYSSVNANRWTSGPRYRFALEMCPDAAQLGLSLDAGAGNTHRGTHLQHAPGAPTRAAAGGRQRIADHRRDGAHDERRVTRDID